MEQAMSLRGALASVVVSILFFWLPLWLVLR